jgi:arylformamidase
MPTHVDLSHTVYAGLITYKGLPAPLICDFLSRADSAPLYADGTTFHIGKIEMVANTGTYIDSPFHRFADGKDLSELELDSLAHLDAVVIRANDRSERGIGKDAFAARELAGKAVLVHTDWSRHWASDAYFDGHPYLRRGAADYLKDAGAKLVGIDSFNIDDTNDLTRPVHTVLLGAGIPICEHMCNLDRLPVDGFRFTGVPVKVRGMGTFPVRAFATFL